jgi:Ca-activated chloride channel family protein
MKRPNSSARSKIASKSRWRVIGAGLTCNLLATLVAAAPSESPPSTLSDLHLLRPLWLLALIPSIALIAALWRGHLRKNDWQQVIDADLLAALSDHSPAQQQRRWPLTLIALAWLLAIVALAGPTWQRLPQPVYQQQEALVIVLDLSPSMYATDAKPSRLVQARREIRDVLRLRAKQGGSTGLIAYAGDAYVVTPLTEDTRTIELLLPSLDPGIMPLPGNNPLLALQRAEQLIRDAQVDQGHILLITDGIPKSDFDALSQFNRSRHHRLSILGVGSDSGAPIPLPRGGFLKNNRGDVIIAKFNQRTIKDWSKRAKVRYRHSHFSDADVESLLEPPLAERAIKQQATELSQRFDSWRDLAPWLALALLPLAALAFRRGWLLGLLLVFTLQPAPPAYAFSWQDLWFNDNQQGQRALGEEDAERAASLFKDDQWRGVARYQDGDYEGAAEEFARQDSSQSNYNRGNALAMQGDLEAAIKAYDRALTLDPDNQDAAQNKRQVEELLEQQQEQEGDSEQDQDGEQGADGDQQDADSDQQKDGSDQQGDEGDQRDPGDGEQNGEGSDNASEDDQQGSGQNEPDSQQNPPSSNGDNEDGSPQPNDSSQQDEGSQQADESTQAEDSENSQAEGSDGDQPEPESASNPENGAAQGTEDPNSGAEEAEQDAASGSGATPVEESSAADQELQQWLRQIPDEPGKLLQRKFDYQYRQQNQRPRETDPEERY